MAHELVEDNVISVSLWPGPVATELVKKTVLAGSGDRKVLLESYLYYFFNGELVFKAN